MSYRMEPCNFLVHRRMLPPTNRTTQPCALVIRSSTPHASKVVLNEGICLSKKFCKLIGLFWVVPIMGSLQVLRG